MARSRGGSLAKAGGRQAGGAPAGYEVCRVGPEVPRKTVEAVFARVERAMAQMPAALRQQAEELQAIPERERANQKVEVEANVLLGLLGAAQEIEAMKARQAKQAARGEAPE